MTSDGDDKRLLRRLWAHVSPRRRLHLVGFVVLVAVGAVAEVASLGMVIPFLAVLSDPERIYDHEAVEPFLQVLGIRTADDLLLPLTLGFCGLAVAAAGVRFGLVWAQTRLGEAIGNDLSEDAFRRSLYQPYLVHARRNSSEVVAALMSKTDTAIHFVIIPLLNLAGSVATGVAIVAFMLWAAPVLTSGAFVLLGGTYAIMVTLNRSLIAAASVDVTIGQTRLAQIVQEGLGGIREVLVGALQPYFVRRFRAADRSRRQAIGTIAIRGNAPRYVVDAVTVVAVGTVVFLAARGPGGLDAMIPTLGALALAVQRLLPMAQQAYFSSTAVQGGKASLVDVLALLDQPVSDAEPKRSGPALSFERAIDFHGVSFRYAEDAAVVLRDVSVEIPKGSRVGVIGETGSGKSTLLDLVMGLILPDSGAVRVDGVPLTAANARSWQRRIAHVPQHVFLADASIAENIAFGAEADEIDMDKVAEAARVAQLDDTIRSLSHGYSTRVGERGVQLSGGQRQRLGLARALYCTADLLVLDEATSALDDATEDAIVRSLDELERSLTIVMVAHRRRSLRNCDFLLEIARDGTVQRRANTAPASAADDSIPPPQ